MVLGSSRSILITGAQGYIGSSLCERLKKTDAIVVELSRKGIGASSASSIVVKGDLFEPRQLFEDTPSFDTIIHLAWLNNQSKSQQIKGKDGSTLNTFALKNLIKLAESKNCQRIIFLSMGGASSKSGDFYLREKYNAEHLIINSEIPIKTIIQSPFVYSAGQANYFLLARLLQMSKFPFVVPMPEKWPHFELIQKSDLIEALFDQIFLKEDDFGTRIIKLPPTDLETLASLKTKLPEFVESVNKKWQLKGTLGEIFLRRINNKHFIFR